MGKRSTTNGYFRQRGGTNASASKLTGPTPAVMPSVLKVVVDPVAAAGTGTGKYIPAGARITHITVVSGHTGGTAPLLDLGLGASVDGLLDGVVADGNVVADLINLVPATGAIEVVAGTGGGTPGTGTSVALITDVMDDDGDVQD
jgi:hypothetical protein